VLVLAIALGVAVGLRDNEKPPASNATPRQSADTTPTTSSASPSPSPSATTARPTGVTVAVPAVGVRARVLPITPNGGALDPPTLNEAYLIEPYGKPGSKDNTVYITGHSWDEGKAVFNALFDRRAQTTEVNKGDEVLVTTADADYTYVVEKTKRYPRNTLAAADEVWRKVPDRLLLITCFQPNDGGEAQDNLVVFATLTSTTPAA
jgi:sortase (surface protein transpeptidase)